MLGKQLSALKHLGNNLDIVISTTHQDAFFIEIKAGEEIIPILDKKDKPLLYTSLNEIYDILRKYNIHEAMLLQRMPYDEMISSDPEGPKVIETPLKF